jgi:hypothetical protein
MATTPAGSTAYNTTAYDNIPANPRYVVIRSPEHRWWRPQWTTFDTERRRGIVFKTYEMADWTARHWNRPYPTDH